MVHAPFYPALLEQNPERFNELALELFRIQAVNNPVYREFLAGIGCNTGLLSAWQDIPALPISFFRSRDVLTGVEERKEQALVFRSSGSTASTASRHIVPQPERYRDAFLRGFRLAYGQPAAWTFLFLLPSYLEREGSSLIWMCRELAALSQQPETGFFLYDHEALWQAAELSLSRQQPTMLLGVSFALWDLATENRPLLPGREHLVVVETGGMKGRRRELLREELHTIICRGLGIDRVHSEYGFRRPGARAKGGFAVPPGCGCASAIPTTPFRRLRQAARGYSMCWIWPMPTPAPSSPRKTWAVSCPTAVLRCWAAWTPATCGAAT
jgi:hypothetical protein